MAASESWFSLQQMFGLSSLAPPCLQHQRNESPSDVESLEQSGASAADIPTAPAIAQLVGHLGVDNCNNQMVPGLIPGGRVLRIAAVLQIPPPGFEPGPPG